MFFKSITVETSLTPPIKFTGGAGGWLARFLKPKVTIETAIGNTVYAPEGEPGDSVMPMVVISILILTVILLWPLTR